MKISVCFLCYRKTAACSPLHRTIASIFFRLLPSNCQFGKMHVWDLELSKLQEMQKQGSVCIAWVYFIGVSIAKRCQRHRSASMRDQGINFQGERYLLPCKNSVCRRRQRQSEETTSMQRAAPFLCLTNGLQPLSTLQSEV